MRPGGGSLARVFPLAAELGRERRRASVPDSLLAAVLGLVSFGEEAWELGSGGSFQVLSSQGHRGPRQEHPASVLG